MRIVMKKVSKEKLSILGFVLLGVSAVTAAIIPDKSIVRVEGADDGTLQYSDDEFYTCLPDLDDSIYSCNVSYEDLTTTTADGVNESYTGEFQDRQTFNNTSLTNSGGSSAG